MDASNGTGKTVRQAQAQGIVSAQAHCTVAEALVLMRSRATSSHRTLDAIASAIIDKSINFRN